MILKVFDQHLKVISRTTIYLTKILLHYEKFTSSQSRLGRKQNQFAHRRSCLYGKRWWKQQEKIAEKITQNPQKQQLRLRLVIRFCKKKKKQPRVTLGCFFHLMSH